MTDGSVSSVQADAASIAKSSLKSVAGTIDGIATGKIDISTSTSAGIVPVLTAGATINTHGGTLANGHYAIAVGTGTSTITGSYVATFTTKPAAVSVEGTVLGATPYGIEIRSSSGSTIPILVSSTTSGTYNTGDDVTVEGVGTAAAAVFATSISGGGTASTTGSTTGTSSSGPAHLLTGDYLGTPWGSTSVSPSRAAKYLNYALTAYTNGNAMHDAGIKVEVYMSPLLVQSNDALYSMTPATGFATTCTKSRISYDYSGNTQWVMNPSASALQSSYTNLVSRYASADHIDEIFLDDAGPVANGRALKPGNPCGYAATTWESEATAMEARLPVHTFINGLNNISDGALAPELPMLANTKFDGGNFEACFGSHTDAEQASWPWTETEQTQLDTVNEGKMFQCMNEVITEASSSQAARLYALASFLLTYNQAHSVLFEEYATPSHVSVMPESQLVPTDPLVAQPASIASLKRGSGYIREYKACYYAGRSIGGCAVVVNPSGAAIERPAFSQTYHHTLALSGNGLLDGGTASLSGAAPPSTMAANSAFVALP
jgi:hypothetical protein